MHHVLYTEHIFCKLNLDFKLELQLPGILVDEEGNRERECSSKLLLLYPSLLCLLHTVEGEDLYNSF